MLFPHDSDVATRLRREGEAVLIELLGTAFPADATYVDSQLTAHAQALELLNGCIDAADADPLRTELTALRASVEAHLNRARELESSTAR